MPVIREARAEDFERVYPLLLEFENSHLSKEDWRQLFIDHSGVQNGRFGWVLVEGDEIVGFLATILSERLVRGERVRLCNTSSWIVNQQYRAYSLALHAKATADKTMAITNLSATPQVLQMMQKLGFTLMDKSERIIVPVVTARSATDGSKILTEAGAVERALHGETLRFYRDHQLPHNRHLLLRTSEGDCYVMMNRTMKKVCGNVRLPFARVHHIASPAIFVKHLEKMVARVAVSFGTVAMIVDDRMLQGVVPWHSFIRPDGKRNAAYRSSTLTANDIDGLYTEAVLLNY